MDAVPWRLERPALDAAAVRRLLHAQFPDLAAESVSRLGEGWDCETWLIDDAWVFRFPKRESVQASLAREALLLPILAERLHIRLPVPEWSGRPDASFPFAFAGYRPVPGRTWNWSARPARRLAAFETDFVAFLNGLHGSTAEARRALAQTGGSYPEDYAPIDWAAELARVRHLLTERLGPETLALVAPLLAGNLPPPDAFRGEGVLLHFDLSEDHVFMDDAGRVLGVIDWADAGFGDPAVDFIEATIWLGPEFLDRALAEYRHPVDAEFRRRVGYGASVVALLNLAYAVERGDAQRAARRQQHLETVMRAAGELTSWHR
ncbi:MAG: phosphotransferase [Gammaproteobacteria bacterium]|nr:phosphotransferase [Gammaproteobacteria bacterium]